jgi:hypothetical protein
VAHPFRFHRKGWVAVAVAAAFLVVIPAGDLLLSSLLRLFVLRRHPERSEESPHFCPDQPSHQKHLFFFHEFSPAPFAINTPRLVASFPSW